MEAQSGANKVETSEYESKISTLISRNITVHGRRTSVRLEPEMWACLKEISDRERCKIHDICTLISMRKKEGTSLTAAIRVFIMLYFRAAVTENGHVRAGHGNFISMLHRAKLPQELIQFFSVKQDVSQKAHMEDYVTWLPQNGIEQCQSGMFGNLVVSEKEILNIPAKG